ncbi:hypothetical protein ACOMHN_058783 [Nucella lapillus]
MEVSDEKSKTFLNSTIKIRLYKSLVISNLLYGCESWTLNAETERRLLVLEHKCYRELLRIHYSEHKTNERRQDPNSRLQDHQD